MEKDLSALRENYGIKNLEEEHCPEQPFELFELWINEAIDAISVDANAMIVSTVGKDLQPTSRTVLLKAYEEHEFVFYTHYDSKKGIEIDENPKVSLIFWWKELERQVRIEGAAHKISTAKSEAYFQQRPKGSQIGATASPQSQAITKKELLENFKQIETRFKDAEQLPLPNEWGGYAVTPTLFEFWQGRPNRMHDRIEYQLKDQSWAKKRLSP